MANVLDMNLQYLSDKAGHTTGVQIQMPIEEWDLLKKKYTEFEMEDETAGQNIPEWQISLGRAEMENVRQGNTELRDWETVRKQYK